MRCIGSVLSGDVGSNRLSNQIPPDINPKLNHFDNMIHELQSFEHVAQEWGVSDETEKNLLTGVQVELPEPNGKAKPTASVAIVTLSTDIISTKCFCNYVVPSFAAHLGVICNYNYGEWLIHLVFDVSTLGVDCEEGSWGSENQYQVIPVGTTRYDILQVRGIGDSLSLAG